MKFRHTSSRIAAVSLTVLALGAVAPVHAESSFQTGAGALTANARLDFRIVIPRFLELQVGSTDATIDLVEFTVPAANLGDGSDIARTNGGVVPVSIRANSGNVTLTGTTLGAMGTTPTGDTISFAEILETSSNPDLDSPNLVDGAASAAITVTPNVGTRVVNRQANWTFAYDNTNVVGAGTYGGIATNNGRVTYTATLP